MKRSTDNLTKARMQHTKELDLDRPSLAWLLISGAGSGLAAVVAVGVIAGRLGVPITGGLLLGGLLLGALPRLVQLVGRRRSPLPARALDRRARCIPADRRRVARTDG
jgi:hypothetical protein